MQKKELIIENFVNFFNSIYSKENNSSRLLGIIDLLVNILDYFYTEYEEIRIEKDVSNISGLCDFKTGCEFVEYYDIKKIKFDKFYPSIIKKLFENKQIKFNIKEIGLLYVYVLDNYQYIIKDKNITEDGIYNCRFFLNSMILISTYNNYGIDNHDLIIEYGRNILNHIIENYNDNYIYVDTDMIIVKSSEEPLLEYLDSLDLKYDISDINFLLFNNKRYAIEEDGDFKLKGILSNSNRTRRNTSDEIINAIETFKMKLLYKNRIKKVKKLLEK